MSGLARESAVFVWPDRALFLGDRSATLEHAHNALELGLALDAEGLHYDTADGPLRGIPGALIRAGAVHRLSIPGPKVAVAYVEPHSVLGGALTARLRGRAAEPLAAGAWRPAFSALLGDPEVSLADGAAALDGLVRQLGVGGTPQGRDPRVRRALALLEAELDDPPRLDALAAQVGLSGSRLRHLFRDQVGVTIRRYVLWTRLRSALLLALAGTSMTEAAHEAGFADAAHFTRSCNQMFGLPPSAFAPVDALFVAK